MTILTHPPVLERDIIIQRQPERIWQAITHPTELANWFPISAALQDDGSLRLDWRGEFTFDVTPKTVKQGKELKWLTAPGNAADQPYMTFSLKATMDGGTHLKVRHAGIQNIDGELWRSTARGWEYQLFSLKHYLEKHEGATRQIVYARVRLPKARRQIAWDRIFGGEVLHKDIGLPFLSKGDAYAFHTVNGYKFAGTVVALDPPRNFAGTVNNLNDGLLRIHLDAINNQRDVHFTLATWDQPIERINILENRIRRLLAQLNA